MTDEDSLRRRAEVHDFISDRRTRKTDTTLYFVLENRHVWVCMLACAAGGAVLGSLGVMWMWL